MYATIVWSFSSGAHLWRLFSRSEERWAGRSAPPAAEERWAGRSALPAAMKFEDPEERFMSEGAEKLLGEPLEAAAAESCLKYQGRKDNQQSLSKQGLQIHSGIY